MNDAARKFLTTALFTLLLSSTTILAQGMSGDRTTSSASQTVSVEVPTVVRLNRPDSRTVTLDGSASATFDETQRWGVVSNSTSGARVTLKAGSLTAEGRSDQSVPVQLRLEKVFGDRWSMDRATDTSKGGPAVVRAASNGAGHAAFRLTITPGDAQNLNIDAGEQYTTTVTGTIRKR